MNKKAKNKIVQISTIIIWGVLILQGSERTPVFSDSLHMADSWWRDIFINFEKR
jgi:hypothetical protein